MNKEKLSMWAGAAFILAGMVLVVTGVYRRHENTTGNLNAIHCVSPLMEPRTVTPAGKGYRTGNYYTAADGFLFIPMPGDVCKIHPILLPLEPKQN